MRFLSWDFSPSRYGKRPLLLRLKVKKAHLQPWLLTHKGGLSEGTKCHAAARQRGALGVADTLRPPSLRPAPSPSPVGCGELKAVWALFGPFPTSVDKCKYPTWSPPFLGEL